MGKIFPFFYFAAALFCNSCRQQTTSFVSTNSVLQLEESFYRSNVEHLKKGKYFRFNNESELSEENDENRLLLSKLHASLDQLDSIDLATAKMIRFIDEIKLELLKKSRENIPLLPRIKPEDKSLWSAKDEQNPLLPVRLALEKLGPEKYPGTNPLSTTEKPLAQGNELWQKLIAYRADVVRFTASYQSGDRTYSFRPKAINTFKDRNDLAEKVEQMMAAGNINHKEDSQMLRDIYLLLTKPVKSKNGQHWITSEFGNLPLAAMITNLSALQNEILDARALAVTLVSIKRTYCGPKYFKNIQFQVLAPDSVQKGEEVKLYVFLAAFEYYLEPEFTCDQVPVGHVENGIATIRTKANGKDKMLLSGTVSFKLPTGGIYGFPWKKVISIKN